MPPNVATCTKPHSNGGNGELAKLPDELAMVARIGRCEAEGGLESWR